MNEISLILLIEGYNIQRLTENLLFYEHFLVKVMQQHVKRIIYHAQWNIYQKHKGGSTYKIQLM